MGELLIQEGTFFHTILTQKFKFNEDRTLQMKNLANNINLLFTNFSLEITNASRQYFKKLKIDESQDQGIIFLSKYIVDILNELSKKIVLITKNIESELVEPLSIFMQNQKSNHFYALKRSEQLLYSIQHNNQLLKQLNQNHQLNELSRTKSAQQKRILKEIVEGELQKCNLMWKDIKNNYINILGQLDLYNSARCTFTMKTQISMVKFINRLVNSTSVQDSLHDYEENFCENQTLSMELKDQMRDRLGKLLIFEQMGDTDINQIVLSKADQKQKMLIDDFIGFFTSRSNFKQQEKAFQEPRTLILQEMKWTNYFLNKLKSNLYTQIQLSNIKFRQLATIIKYIFALVVEVQDNEGILYNLLYISYRVRYKTQYLIKELGKHENFWRNTLMWESIIDFIGAMKLKIRGQVEPRRNTKFRKLFSKQTWMFNKASYYKKIKTQKIIQDVKVYQSLCQVNYYMAKLQIQQHFIFEFILRQALKFNISKQNTRKLLQYHYMNKMNIINKISSNYMKRKERLERQYKGYKSKQQKFLKSLDLVIQYLPLGPYLVNLLSLNKKSNIIVKDIVLRRFLIHEKNLSLTKKNRLLLYNQICQPPFTRSVYQRMVGEVPDFTDHIEIINLDARRSLGWDEKLRIQMIQVLKTFSYYHPDNGYLQGMNYLCQNILKLTEDNFICYSIFQHLMNNQYYNLYTGNFDGLKIKIYQFMRILQQERPQLYQHLRIQTIQGQHFLLAWAITLWGEMVGDLSWIMWDGFLLQGWQWWIKTCLWFLKILQAQLLKMNFEQIMRCFSDLHSSLLSYSFQQLIGYGIQASKIKFQINSIEIQKDVLLEIQKQYKLKANTINQYLKSIYTKGGKR